MRSCRSVFSRCRRHFEMDCWKMARNRIFAPRDNLAQRSAMGGGCYVVYTTLKWLDANTDVAWRKRKPLATEGQLTISFNHFILWVSKFDFFVSHSRILMFRKQGCSKIAWSSRFRTGCLKIFLTSNHIIITCSSKQLNSADSSFFFAIPFIIRPFPWDGLA